MTVLLRVSNQWILEIQLPPRRTHKRICCSSATFKLGEMGNSCLLLVNSHTSQMSSNSCPTEQSFVIILFRYSSGITQRQPFTGYTRIASPAGLRGVYIWWTNIPWTLREGSWPSLPYIWQALKRIQNKTDAGHFPLPGPGCHPGPPGRSGRAFPEAHASCRIRSASSPPLALESAGMWAGRVNTLSPKAASLIAEPHASGHLANFRSEPISLGRSWAFL